MGRQIGQSLLLIIRNDASCKIKILWCYARPSHRI